MDNKIEWTNLLDSNVNFEVQTKVLPTKGHLVYEYNPLRNYRLDRTMFEYKGEYYTKNELKNTFNIILGKAFTVNVTENNVTRQVTKVYESSLLNEEIFPPSSSSLRSLYEELLQYNIISVLSEDRILWLMESLEGWYKGTKNIDSDITLKEKGELVDFITDELQFSINHPVNIVPQYSYDGSVNLILNDGVNIPRMINTRFSATGRNTYEIVDRKGNNDTNIYDKGSLFDIDTSLYKRVISIPKIEFKGVNSGGNLKVGNYHFYFKLSDADGNETDFVGESGLVSIFIGFNHPLSVTTGTSNQNSYKSAKFYISNIDSAYNYLYVYYSRYMAEADEEFNVEYKKVDKKFIVNNAGEAIIIITGTEETVPLSASDINLNYNLIDSAKALTSCLNMLFLGNVHKPEIPYLELSDLSLRFIPYLKEELYDVSMDENYVITTSEKGYIDPRYIYNKTGYWGEEIYRLGIVYILPNNELTPVFNIRGANNIMPFLLNTTIGGETLFDDRALKLMPAMYNGEYPQSQFSEIPVYKTNTRTGEKERNYIQYNESSYRLLPQEIFDGSTKIQSKGYLEENVKGVVRFKPFNDTNTIYGIDIRVSDEVIQELKKYVKGYFFVRQTRIPTILAQGITIGVDKYSHTPCVATADGSLQNYASVAGRTHIVTKDINDVNYVSEGFISRFKFKFEKKSSGLFGSILKGLAIAVGVLAIAAATVFTCGAAGAVAAGTAASFASAISAGAAAVGTAIGAAATAVTAVTGITAASMAAGAAVVVGSVAVGTAATIAALGAILEIRYAVGRAFTKVELNGRKTECPSGYYIEETDDSRKLYLDYSSRVIIVDPSRVNVQGILCPDYEINLGFYNSIFTGNKHTIGLTNTLCINGLSGHSSNYFTNRGRHYYVPQYYDMGIRNTYEFKVIGVPSCTTLTGIDDLKFRSKAGTAEEAWRYEPVGGRYEGQWDDFNEKQINSDIIRGNFGAYLAFNDENNRFSPAETVNIYIPDYSLSNMSEYFKIRMQDTTPFYAITDRYDINLADDNLLLPLQQFLVTKLDRSNGYQYIAYRGDCYICQFTHRMHWNFQDPGAPYNDEVVQDDTWRQHYNVEEPDQYGLINLGDVNAVLIGTWVTFRVRSSNNLNVRTLDGSDIAESGMTGHPKGYFPYYDLDVSGVFKHSDSEIYNKGFTKSVSERYNMELPDVPYIKNWFGTRIMYSDVYINDAYKNSFRVFKPTAYRDYTREYGEIVKLITLESDLICIFEHGVARIPINREQVVKQAQSGNDQVTTFNVLPETLTVLSDMYGSQWADSVLKTPGKAGNTKLFIYGVDTVAKKIWRTDGQTLECISDFKVQEFLNNNITLGERELTPILGIRNVKTVYNAFKRDVMFTFYDNTYGFEEKVWNLCWNELLEKFITFYSWVPSFMENINNIPFSFDRNVSKWIAKLGTSHANNSFADGITLTNTVVNNILGTNDIAVDSTKFPFTYMTKGNGLKTVTLDATDDSILEKINGVTKPLDGGFIGVLGIANRVLPDENLFYTIDYTLERDPWKNYKNFAIKKIGSVKMESLYDSKFHTGINVHPDEENPDDTIGLEYPIYGLFFSTANTGGFLFVYDSPIISEDHAVYTNNNRTGRVKVIAPPSDPEVMMSELYYRNSAGHAYADYDVNKVKYLVDNSISSNTYADPTSFDPSLPLDPEQVYNIEQVMQYVAKNYYGTDRLPGDNNDGDNSARGEALLTRSGGPFDYDTIVYLGTRPNFYACSGGLGDLIDRPYKHAPFTAHYMYGSYIEETVGKRIDVEDLPIFKDINGKRPMLPKEEQLNPDKIVTLLNIKATINILDANNPNSLSDTYYNIKSSHRSGTSLVNAAQYESVVGLTTKWNMQFLTSDFWKHGQAGLIDIADDIYPTYWYGKQHPFEFECVVVDDPSLHKIFTNLELVANKAKPESFHYEVVGETYDFAKDKVNMYFRQEALKALWLYNGSDITYDRNFLKVQPRQLARSADLIHTYYSRRDTINDVEDYYIHVNYPQGYDYRHLSGAEIVYYPTRQEFRIWNHAMAVDLNDLSQDDARSIISGNCQYLEDRWKVTINPITVCYKNEYKRDDSDTLPLIHPSHSTWAKAYDSNQLLPTLPIINSPVPTEVKESGRIVFPGTTVSSTGTTETDLDKSNALYHLYDLTNFGINGNYSPLDTTNWLNDVSIYRYDFGEAHNRKEVDVRDKFVKIRIRYSGEELAIIDFLNTIYLVSYA